MICRDEIEDWLKRNGWTKRHDFWIAPGADLDSALSQGLTFSYWAAVMMTVAAKEIEREKQEDNGK